MTSANTVDGATGVGEQLPAALAAAWRAIQRRHPDVPAAAVYLADTEVTRLCQLAENRWPADPEAAERGHRLFVGPGVLGHGAQGVLEALLHTAAHGLAAVRGIAADSRRGQYHNKRFAALAEEVGLEVADAGRPGWAATSVPLSTAEAYATELDQLSAAIAARPEPQPRQPAAGSRHSRGKLRALCACPDPLPIWASARTLAEKRPTCSVCGQAFTADHDQDDRGDQ